MAEYISRYSALAFQCEVEPVMCKSIATGEVFSATPDAALVKFLNALPAADVRPVVRGKWIYTSTEPLGYICSECGKGCCRFDYCPNCGADMRETNDEKA